MIQWCLRQLLATQFVRLRINWLLPITKLKKDFLAGKKTQEEIEELGAGALRNAVVDGDVDNGSVMAGQIAGLVSKEETCAEILEDIYLGAAKVIQKEAARWADVKF